MMMKRSTILCLLLLAICWSSCSNDENTLSTAKNESVLGISGASLEAKFETKASTTITTDGDSLRVFRLAKNDYVAASAIFQYSIAAPAGWKYKSGESVLYLNNKIAKVCAIFPAVKGYLKPDSLALKAQSYSVAQDYCYSVLDSASNSASTVSFTDMKRAYSQITLSITKNDNYTGECLVKSISISGDEICNTAALNMTLVPAVYSQQTKGIVSDTLLTLKPTSSTDAKTHSFLAIPADTLKAEKPITVKLKVDGKEMNCTVAPGSTNFTDFTKMKAGNNYTFKVQINGTSLQIQSISIEEWVSKDIATVLEPTVPQS